MTERVERRVVATEVTVRHQVLMNLADADCAPDRQWCDVLWHGTPGMWPESYAIVVRQPHGEPMVTYVTPGCPVTVR